MSSLDDTRIFGKPPTRDPGKRCDELGEGRGACSRDAATYTSALRRRSPGTDNGKSVLPSDNETRKRMLGRERERVRIENASRLAAAALVCPLLLAEDL